MLSASATVVTPSRRPGSGGGKGARTPQAAAVSSVDTGSVVRGVKSIRRNRHDPARAAPFRPVDRAGRLNANTIRIEE
ncbi:hypothetical protein [Mangrovibrevibacter kandeliae]|uniref:hypothetical protein n=1 Tax=Mangrovibrevibacter kandeliae TaxID=2968473 RepID=UPI00211966A0|nr:hypothetical protein [Aurantimonas sp. CSK15Z-1]MCQ8780906.1 hypothetical protein [Aurantimonas sp. CSK15Z-1]